MDAETLVLTSYARAFHTGCGPTLSLLPFLVQTATQASITLYGMQAELDLRERGNGLISRVALADVSFLHFTHSTISSRPLSNLTTDSDVRYQFGFKLSQCTLVRQLFLLSFVS